MRDLLFACRIMCGGRTIPHLKNSTVSTHRRSLA